jgi:hypothetical protein
MLIFSLGFPLLYLFLFGFMEKSSGNNLKVSVDENLAYEFDNQNQQSFEYLDGLIPINIEYATKEELLSDFEKGKLPVIYYLDEGEKTLYLNMNKNNSTFVYNLMRSKFYPIEAKHFNLKKRFSMNYALLSMVFNFLLLFSSLNIGSSLLDLEIKKHNILILLKSGISKGELIISKVMGVFIMQIVTFAIFYSVAILTKQLTLNLNMIWYLPFIIIPTSLIGIFISSVTANEGLKSILPMLFWFPSIFYGAIKESLSPLVTMIMKLNPLILLSELIEQIIRNDVSYQLLIILSGISVVLFFMSIFFMKRTIIKSM